MSGIESNLPNDLRDLLIRIIAFSFIYETKIMLICDNKKDRNRFFVERHLAHSN